MGCCMSHVPPPMPEVNEMNKVGSYTETTKPTEPKKFAHKPEPQMTKPKKSSIDKPIENSPEEEELTKETSYTPDAPIENQLSAHDLRMQARKSELLREQEKLAQLQQEAFDQQLATQQARNYKRLYDIWEEYANQENGQQMDMYGLTKALSVFGMIIDTSKDFQRHIFKKFDLDNEKAITYNDFSATIASFVGSNTDDDALQTLFEIFDINQDGYLEIQEMARILLAQNQIAVVVTGQQAGKTKHVVYTKKQCLKQARRMVSEFDSDEFHDNKISFDEFRTMMHQRTENDMLIDHMQAPSISMKSGDHDFPVFIENESAENQPAVSK